MVMMMPLVYLKRVLIDIIGTFNGGTANLLDVTLRRKAAVVQIQLSIFLENGILIQQIRNNLGSRIAVKVPKGTNCRLR
jgi:hypothetical protein